MNLALLALPLMSKLNTEPAPRGSSFCASAWLGWLSSSGWPTRATSGWLARNCTTFSVLAMWRAMRSDRVSMPCRISQAVCGLMQAPKSRRPSRRARSRKAPTVTFLGEHHVVKAVVGRGQFGELAMPACSAFPVKAAAIDHQHRRSPCHGRSGTWWPSGRPGRRPCASGFISQGEVRVESTSRGTPASCAMAATDGGDVQHVQPRVAHGLAKQQLGVGAHRRAPAVDVARFHEGGLNAKRRMV
jgi:hypothetical protein